ncbi:p21-activated protein kinase-interacting protein 1-like [Antedon mediterranea]|uniref:p21-activated protein kinase-interacting protein 1-like n=1 Tax=Antedon mediterranea TaxID=105859 RepID=UPI003AF54209
MGIDVVVGCYERSLIGYSLIKNDEKEYTFQVKFTNNAHTGCVKTIASSDNFLASGSTDEMIQLFNLKSNCELGSLMHHKGSISSLCFHDNKHMLSCSDDGTVCIWSTKDWDCHKVLRGHRSEVLSVAVHPSGKLAMSVGKDKTLRTWNLIQGRSAYITNLKAVADLVLWNASGTKYMVAIDNRVDVYLLETAMVISTYTFTGKILCAALIQDDYVVIGGEGDIIEIFKSDVPNPVCLCKWKAHTNRVKAMQHVAREMTDGGAVSNWLFTASSDGHIKAWQIDIEKISEKPCLIAAVDTTARLTCLTVRSTKTAQSDASDSVNNQSENTVKSKRKRNKKQRLQERRKDNESKEKEVDDDRVTEKKK